MKFATPSSTSAASAGSSLAERGGGGRDSALELVCHTLALHLGIPDGEVHEQQHLEDALGLDPLDLVLIALRLEELGEAHMPFPLSEFPVGALEGVATVGDLADLVGLWWQTPPRRPESGLHARVVAIALSS
jgi:acyl carrier protein